MLNSTYSVRFNDVLAANWTSEPSWNIGLHSSGRWLGIHSGGFQRAQISTAFQNGASFRRNMNIWKRLHLAVFFFRLAFEHQSLSAARTWSFFAVYFASLNIRWFVLISNPWGYSTSYYSSYVKKCLTSTSQRAWQSNVDISGCWIVCEENFDYKLKYGMLEIDSVVAL